MRFLYTIEIDLGFLSYMKIYVHSENFPVDFKPIEILSGQQKVGNFSPVLPCLRSDHKILKSVKTSENVLNHEKRSLDIFFSFSCLKYY